MAEAVSSGKELILQTPNIPPSPNYVMFDLEGLPPHLDDHGDTITVLQQNKALKVRLHSVDCPEKRQEFGEEAKEFTAQHCLNKLVRIESIGLDCYGRTVANVMFLPNGQSLNHELVENGYAWWCKRYAPNDKDLELLESDAKLNRLGLWSSDNATAPWEFRHHPVDQTVTVPAVDMLQRCLATFIGAVKGLTTQLVLTAPIWLKVANLIALPIVFFFPLPKGLGLKRIAAEFCALTALFFVLAAILL